MKPEMKLEINSLSIELANKRLERFLELIIKIEKALEKNQKVANLLNQEVDANWSFTDFLSP